MSELTLFEKNITALAPMHAVKLGYEGWCFCLASLWMLAGFANQTDKFKTRLRWLSQNLSQKPLIIDNKSYYSFEELLAFYNEIKFKPNLSLQEEKFKKNMLDAFAFTDALLAYQKPKEILERKTTRQNFPWSFEVTKPIIFDKTTSPPLIYNNTWKVSPKNFGALIQFLNKLDNIGLEANPTIFLQSSNHSIGLRKDNGSWHFFDPNEFFLKKSFSLALNPENLNKIFNFDDSTSQTVFLNLKVYISPFSAAAKKADELKTNLENSLLHKTARLSYLSAINETDMNGTSVLGLACQMNDSVLAKELVAKGASLSFLDAQKMDAMDIAAINGNTDLIQFFINSDSSLKKEKALRLAATHGHLETVKLLAKNHARLDQVFADKQTLLHKAVNIGNLDLTRFFIQSGLDVNSQDQLGYTPLYRAAAYGDVAIIDYLLSNHADLHAKTLNGETAANAAVLYGNLSALKFLASHGLDLNKADNFGNTLLHEAALKGHEHIADYLLTQKLDVNAKNDESNTPMHTAAKYGQLDFIKYLLAHHADMKVINTDGNTPLHLAATAGKYECLKFLIEKFPDLVHVKNKSGETLLHSAAKSGNVSVMRLLLDKGFDIESKNRLGDTALIIATRNNHIDLGKFLINKKANVHVINNNFDSPLLLATQQCQPNKYQLIKTLIDNYANVNLPDAKKTTLLHFAVYKQDKNLVKLLLNNGADFTAKDSFSKNTPLLLAAYKGCKDIADLLIQTGATIDTYDKNHILKLASSKSAHSNMANILLKTLAKHDILSPELVLELLLIHLKKNPVDAKSPSYQKSKTFQNIEHYITKTRQYAQNPNNKSIQVDLWKDAFNYVIQELDNKKKWQGTLKMLKPYAKDQKNPSLKNNQT